LTGSLNLAPTGLLIVVVIALAFTAFDPNGIGDRNRSNDTGDSPGSFGGVPNATPAVTAQTSSIPYPTADECTVEVTREELIQDLQDANTAPEPELCHFEARVKPTEQQAQAIMKTYREWQACSPDTPEFGLAYAVQLQTPWYTAHTLPLFTLDKEGEYKDMRPVSEEQIEEYADSLLNNASGGIVEAATPPPLSRTPDSRPATPARLAIPPDATGALNRSTHR